MRDWTAFKRSFTPEQEAALWQFFIDHSQVQPNGYLGIQFYVHDVDDFWRRVNARFNGDFARYERKDKETKQLKYERLMSELYVHRKISRQFGEVVRLVDERGTVSQRLILYLYRKARAYLTKIDVGDATA